MNEGTCIESGSGYSCICRGLFSGQNCEMYNQKLNKQYSQFSPQPTQQQTSYGQVPQPQPSYGPVPQPQPQPSYGQVVPQPVPQPSYGYGQPQPAPQPQYSNINFI
jgi:hypothetical protein